MHNLPMAEGIWWKEDRVCDDIKCGRIITVGDFYFTDPEGGIFCESCGQCIRYERKRAAQREQNKEPVRVIIGLEEE